MKLTDPDVIKDGEKDLINAIEEDLDLDSINEIIKDKLKVKNLESKGGKIIVHNNEIAFEIKFELSMGGSVMFDRDGNYIPDNDEKSIDDSNAAADIDDDKTDNVDEIDEHENNEVDLDTTGDLNEEIELDTDELSEIDLDVDGFEDTEEDELDFSDDEDIDDILKESRNFWENKKNS